MNLLVTGGAGFIGSCLIRHLLDVSGQTERETLGLRTLVNLDALTYAGNLANLREVQSHPLYRFVHGDITDQALVDKIFHDYDITAVLHLAAESHVDRSIDNPAAFIHTNIAGTHRLLEAARGQWAGRKDGRFIQVSTDEVFGSLAPHDPPFNETTAYAPNSPYAASKAAADHLARAYHRTYDLPVIISNCSNNYGPYQFPEKLIPLTILNALENRSLPVYGDGGQVRDWLYVEDHVRALIALLHKGTPGQVYTLGGGHELTNLTLVQTLCDHLQARIPRPSGPYRDLISFVPDRPGHDRRYAIDFSRAQRELGWTPQENWTTGLARTLDWYLENRPWCDAITAGTYRRQRLGLASV